MTRRIYLLLALGSVVALSLAAAQVATATHSHPIGATPVRIPYVPAFKACETVPAPNSLHGPPLNFPSCNPPALVSATAKGGAGSIGFAKIVVCESGNTLGACTTQISGTTLPDVRLWGSSRDVQCQTGTPAGCSPGADYNPNGASGPYTSICTTTANCNNAQPAPVCKPSGTSEADCIAGTDITATAELAGATAGTFIPSDPSKQKFAGHAIRVTDHYNCDPTAVTGPNTCPASPTTSDRPATMIDLQFPVPVDCIPTTDTTVGSACGVNTTANALVGGSVIPNKQAVVEIGEIETKDSGSNGTRGDSDDQLLGVQGIYLP